MVGIIAESFLEGEVDRGARRSGKAVPGMSKYFHDCGLVLPFWKRQTEVPERRTKQNVTNGPVLPDLLYSKLPVLRVGTDLQDPRQY